MGTRQFSRGRRLVARLTHGADLLEEITAIAEEQRLAVAEVRGLGALKRARLSYYDQNDFAYIDIAVDEPVEIASLLGTVSRRDGTVAAHIHVALTGRDGRCIGGHVVPGCIVFAGEIVLQEMLGEPLEREYDEQTGLWLWRGL